MGSGNNQDSLTAAYIDQTAVIRVEGRGSFRISPPMKQFIHRVIKSKSANRILIDMSDCIGMDSTFMGVLAGLSCFIKEKPGVSLKLVNLSVEPYLGVDSQQIVAAAGQPLDLAVHPVVDGDARFRAHLERRRQVLDQFVRVGQIAHAHRRNVQVSGRALPPESFSEVRRHLVLTPRIKLEIAAGRRRLNSRSRRKRSHASGQRADKVSS